VPVAWGARTNGYLGKLKSAKSEAAVEELAKSVQDIPTVPIEYQATTKEKAEEDAIRDVISRMKQTLAITGDRGLELQSKFFDWMSCHPGPCLHPVCILKFSMF
jgi:hypothetical protein